MNTSAVFLSLVFLLSTLLSGISTALQKMGKLIASEELQKHPDRFFFQRYLDLFFKHKKWEGILFCINFTKHILQLGYAGSALFFALTLPSLQPHLFALHEQLYSLTPLWVFIIVAIVISLSIFIEFAMNLIATSVPKQLFHNCAFFASILLLPFSPATFVFLTLSRLILKKVVIPPPPAGRLRVRDKILEMLHDSDLASSIDPYDRKLILSVASFKDRLVREVMVPRVDIYSLPSQTSLKEAMKVFNETGYSRIPVYQDNIDRITGVLLYKDVLGIYAKETQNLDFQHNLNQPIDKWMKPILYTPETKRISNLLQEFRSKQIHLAIVVDEYGGTQGIVTIEDILEELVGEIADEHDVDEELLFSPLPTGDWVVDAKMSIIDIEKQLEVSLPHSPEYETIGGYIFHKAGAIPGTGWILHHDAFDIEVLSSSERAIEKVRITPHMQLR